MRALGPRGMRVDRDPRKLCQPSCSPPWRSAPGPRQGCTPGGPWARGTVWEGAERDLSLHSWARLGGHGSPELPQALGSHSGEEGAARGRASMSRPRKMHAP